MGVSVNNKPDGLLFTHGFVPRGGPNLNRRGETAFAFSPRGAAWRRHRFPVYAFDMRGERFWLTDRKISHKLFSADICAAGVAWMEA